MCDHTNLEEYDAISTNSSYNERLGFSDSISNRMEPRQRNASDTEMHRPSPSNLLRSHSSSRFRILPVLLFLVSIYFSIPSLSTALPIKSDTGAMVSTQILLLI